MATKRVKKSKVKKTTQPADPFSALAAMFTSDELINWNIVDNEVDKAMNGQESRILSILSKVKRP